MLARCYQPSIIRRNFEKLSQQNSETMSTETSHGGRSDYQGIGEKITDPAQIARLLKRLMESRALLAATIPGVNAIYNSVILGVLPEEGYLLLDELNPEDGHKHVINAAKFHCFTRHRGVEIHFASHVLEVGQEAQGAFYRVAFPETVDYKQRRQSYRVRIWLSQNVSVTIENDEAQRLTGRVYDISAGGLGAYVDRNTRFSVGQVLPSCTIQLPDNKQISSAIEIRYAKLDEQTGELRIGARFLNLSRTERNTIGKFIAALEREMLRKRPRD